MNIPYSLEHLYLSLRTRRSFPSGAEDAIQIAHDLDAVSEFFCETSRKRNGVRVQELTPQQIQNLMRGYSGVKVLGHRFRFVEDAAS